MLALTCEQHLMIVQTIILFVTAGVIAWYSYETYKLRKAAEHQTKLQLDAHTFDAITRVCQILSSRDAIRRRRWLYENFKEDLDEALKQKPLTTKEFNHALQIHAKPLGGGQL